MITSIDLGASSMNHWHRGYWNKIIGIVLGHRHCKNNGNQYINCKSLQNHANPFKLLQIITNLNKSLQILANPCKALQILTTPYKSLGILTNPERGEVPEARGPGSLKSSPKSCFLFIILFTKACFEILVSKHYTSDLSVPMHHPPPD